MLLLTLLTRSTTTYHSNIPVTQIQRVQGSLIIFVSHKHSEHISPRSLSTSFVKKEHFNLIYMFLRYLKKLITSYSTRLPYASVFHTVKPTNYHDLSSPTMSEWLGVAFLALYISIDWIGLGTKPLSPKCERLREITAGNSMQRETSPEHGLDKNCVTTCNLHWRVCVKPC